MKLKLFIALQILILGCSAHAGVRTSCALRADACPDVNLGDLADDDKAFDSSQNNLVGHDSVGSNFNESCEKWRANPSTGQDASQLGNEETQVSENISKFRESHKKIAQSLDSAKQKTKDDKCKSYIEEYQKCVNATKSQVDNYEKNLCSVATS